MSLKSQAKTGKGAPFPDDVLITGSSDYALWQFSFGDLVQNATAESGCIELAHMTYSCGLCERSL